MGKRASEQSCLIQDFKPFVMKKGLLWIPYTCCGQSFEHCMTPEVALKGVANALALLSPVGSQALPFIRPSEVTRR
jgi:hypothetical protein